MILAITIRVIMIMEAIEFIRISNRRVCDGSMWVTPNSKIHHYIKSPSVIVWYMLSDSTLHKLLASPARHAIHLLFNFGIAACQTHLRGERVISLRDTVCPRHPVGPLPVFHAGWFGSRDIWQVTKFSFRWFWNLFKQELLRNWALLPLSQPVLSTAFPWCIYKKSVWIL